MSSLKIKTGDNVMVIAGKDKGKKGKIVKTFPHENRVTVEGVNVLTKHNKPRSAQDKGGKTKQEAPIDVSNVMVICSGCNKPVRVGFKIVNGKKVRVCAKCGKTLASAKLVKAEAKKEAKVAAAETKAETKTAEVKKVSAAKPETKATEVKKAETKPADKAAKTEAKPAEKKTATKTETATAKKPSTKA